jgi:hypothetical protein
VRRPPRLLLGGARQVQRQPADVVDRGHQRGCPTEYVPSTPITVTGTCTGRPSTVAEQVNRTPGRTSWSDGHETAVI